MTKRLNPIEATHVLVIECKVGVALDAYRSNKQLAHCHFSDPGDVAFEIPRSVRAIEPDPIGQKQENA